MIENALRDKDPGLSLITEGTVTYWILRWIVHNQEPPGTTS